MLGNIVMLNDSTQKNDFTVTVLDLLIDEEKNASANRALFQYEELRIELQAYDEQCIVSSRKNQGIIDYEINFEI